MLKHYSKAYHETKYSILNILLIWVDLFEVFNFQDREYFDRFDLIPINFKYFFNLVKMFLIIQKVLMELKRHRCEKFLKKLKICS
jgi:hypothetical protein